MGITANNVTVFITVELDSQFRLKNQPRFQNLDIKNVSKISIKNSNNLIRSNFDQKIKRKKYNFNKTRRQKKVAAKPDG